MTRALAIDIGGTKTLVALIDGAHVLDERRSATTRGADPSQWCDAIFEAARDWEGYAHVGAAVSGVIVDGTWSAMNLETLSVPAGFALERELTRRFNRPVACFNDAQAAAWGEHRFGAGRMRDLVYVTISTGIGGGAVMQGRLLIGRGGLGASVGLMRVGAELDGPRIEDISAGRWLARSARSLGRGVDARGVFEAADRGETWARGLITSSADVVAALLINLQLLFDPPAIVIGGGIGLADGYADALRARLDRQPTNLRPDLRLAALGHNASVVGAADLAGKA